MNIKSWQDVLLEVVEADPADFTDRKNICISPKDLGEILRAALQERDTEIERLTAMPFASEAVRAFVYGKKIDAQRKVLAQALEALQELNQSDGKDRTAGQLSEAVLQAEAAITAIQELLK